MPSDARPGANWYTICGPLLDSVGNIMLALDTKISLVSGILVRVEPQTDEPMMTMAVYARLHLTRSHPPRVLNPPFTHLHTRVKLSTFSYPATSLRSSDCHHPNSGNPRPHLGSHPSKDASVTTTPPKSQRQGEILHQPTVHTMVAFIDRQRARRAHQGGSNRRHNRSVSCGRRRTQRKPRADRRKT